MTENCHILHVKYDDFNYYFLNCLIFHISLKYFFCLNFWLILFLCSNKSKFWLILFNLLFFLLTPFKSLMTMNDDCHVSLRGLLIACHELPSGTTSLCVP